MWVLIRYLPGDSACAALARDGKPEWTLLHSLVDDLRIVWTGSKKDPAKPHPLRPKPLKRSNAAALAAGRRRQAARRKAIAEGRIT